MKNVLSKVWNLLDKILRFFVFNIFRMRISEESWSKFLQFVKFCIVGLSNTIISYCIYAGTLLLLQAYRLFPQIDYLISQLFGFIVSVAWSFFWNRKYVFNTTSKQGSWLRALIKTYISYAFTGLFLNSILSILWIEQLHVHKLIAPILNLLITIPLNFLLNKFWAFRK